MPRNRKAATLPRRVPTLEGMAFFRRVRDLCQGKAVTLDDIAQDCGLSKSKVWKLLKEIEVAVSPPDTSAAKRICLVKRAPALGITGVTKAGERLYRLAEEFFAEHARLVERVMRAESSEAPEVRVAATNVVMDHVWPGIVARYRREHGERTLVRTVRTKSAADIPRVILDGGADLGIGPMPPGGRAPAGIEARSLPLRFPMCLVCSPTHPLAVKFRQGDAKEVKRTALAALHVFTLSFGGDTGMEWDIPSPDARKGGDRINVEAYETVIAFTRLGLGVGLVPQWPWVLQAYELLGQIVCIPVDKVSPIELALFVSAKGKWSDEIRDMKGAIDNHINELCQYQKAQRSAAHSATLSALSHLTVGQYVSRTSTGCARWRECTVEWTESGPSDVSGVATDEEASGGGRYTLKGELDGRLLHLRATAERGKDRWLAAFTCFTRNPDAAVGTWTGFDDAEKSVAGLFILSTEHLTWSERNEVLSLAGLRVFLNAEETVVGSKPAS